MGCRPAAAAVGDSAVAVSASLSMATTGWAWAESLATAAAGMTAAWRPGEWGPPRLERRRAPAPPGADEDLAFSFATSGEACCLPWSFGQGACASHSRPKRTCVLKSLTCRTKGAKSLAMSSRAFWDSSSGGSLAWEPAPAAHNAATSRLMEARPSLFTSIRSKSGWMVAARGESRSPKASSWLARALISIGLARPLLTLRNALRTWPCCCQQDERKSSSTCEGTNRRRPARNSPGVSSPSPSASKMWKSLSVSAGDRPTGSKTAWKRGFGIASSECSPSRTSSANALFNASRMACSRWRNLKRRSSMDNVGSTTAKALSNSGTVMSPL
mmetsp:Transcript_68017/g.196970  ORF Transcript_68017/g.196970 Transcript_68017/m.196970 type:complete len:329 (+) Transcript_68017:497-1483(+)